MLVTDHLSTYKLPEHSNDPAMRTPAKITPQWTNSHLIWLMDSAVCKFVRRWVNDREINAYISPDNLHRYGCMVRHDLVRQESELRSPNRIRQGSLAITGEQSAAT